MTLPFVRFDSARAEQNVDSTADFREIFQHYGRYIWRVLRRLGVPDADLPDLVQDVFVVLRRKLHQVNPPEALRSFIYGIAVREASNYLRSARVRRERITDLPPDTAADAHQHHALERAEALKLLSAALQRLDEEKRLVFVLYELEELEMQEVAEAVGCPLQTAYARLYAARKLVTTAFSKWEASQK